MVFYSLFFIHIRLFVKSGRTLLTAPRLRCYFCIMKTKFHFTRGEWAAALFLLTVMTACNFYYFFRDIRPKPSCNVHRYEDRFRQFALEQQRLADSVEAVRLQSFPERPRIRSDTIPPSQKQMRKPLYEIVRIELNSCDSVDLLAVPQFGSKRAAKLVEYRDKLGGFHSFAQLLEVYVLQNIDTGKLQPYLYIDRRRVKKLNVNTATYQELVSHPYFDAYLTKLILRHREKSGSIRDLDELQQITHAYPELIEKLRPYVVF